MSSARRAHYLFTGVLIDTEPIDVVVSVGVGVGVALSYLSRPRWLSWMRRPTGDQEVAGSTPAEVGNILSWRLIM